MMIRFICTYLKMFKILHSLPFNICISTDLSSGLISHHRIRFLLFHTVHSDGMRNSCRACRFQRCIAAGMGLDKMENAPIGSLQKTKKAKPFPSHHTVQCFSVAVPLIHNAQLSLLAVPKSEEQHGDPRFGQKEDVASTKESFVLEGEKVRQIFSILKIK